MRKLRDPYWPKRFATIDAEVDEIILPSEIGEKVSQDVEWCEVIVGGRRRRIRFHDYHKLYDIPGMYERLFYERLCCTSPSRVVGLLEAVLDDEEEDLADLRVLDVGAGNGMVGDELGQRDAESIVGIDIIDEAKTATQRDRPGLYDDYFVADLTDLPESVEEPIRERKLNCLTTVAALGFGDIPPQAFIKALDLIETPAWVAFNIKESFLQERDDTGFCRLIRQLSREQIIQPRAYWRYCHRLSITGEKLYYVAMIARKQKDVPDHLMETD